MPNFSDKFFELKSSRFVCVGIFAIALLTACKSTPTSVPPAALQKAENYLRSQFRLASSVAIATHAQSVQQLSQADLCQTGSPTQLGFEIVLEAEGSRYTLHTNQDGSAIELCSSEDAKPESTNKFSGAGYTLRYPKDWQVKDEGLETSGQNLVRFSPSSSQNSQPYVVVARIPIDKSQSQPVHSLETSAEPPQNLKTTVFDAKSKGEKSGSQLEYTQKIANKSGTATAWRVKVLLINVEKFVYRIYSYQPESEPLPDKNFDLFVESFKAIE